MTAPGAVIRATYDAPLALLDGAISEPLRNPRGVAYTNLPCSIEPECWDDDADDYDRFYAREVCYHRCKALQACWARRLALGPLASGVWAGRILPRKTDDEPESISDATLAAWAHEAGVTPRRSKA